MTARAGGGGGGGGGGGFPGTQGTPPAYGPAVWQEIHSMY